MMVFLLCLFGFVAEEPANRPVSGLRVWWRDAALLKELDLEPEVQKRLVAALERCQLDYFVIRTQTKAARRQVWQRYEDLTLEPQEIRLKHEAEYQSQLQKMWQLQLDARLLVRESLDRKALERLLQLRPRIFRVAWFKEPSMPVVMGNPP